MCRFAKADCVIINLYIDASNEDFSYWHVRAYKVLMTIGPLTFLILYTGNKDLKNEQVVHTQSNHANRSLIFFKGPLYMRL